MKDIIEPAYEIYVRGYTNAARNLRNMEGRIESTTKKQARKNSQGIYSSKSIDEYTRAQYNSYGWVVINKVLTVNELNRFYKQFSNEEMLEFKYKKSSDGYYMIPTGDKSMIDTKIVFVEGTAQKPYIDRVLEITGIDDNEKTYYINEVLDNEEYDNSYDDLEAYAGKGVFRTYTQTDFASYSKLKERYNRAGGKDTSKPSYRETGNSKDIGTVKFQSSIDTPEFKRWFGNSKVVDDNGNPLVVYHQTAKDFTVFNTDNPKAGLNDSETPNGIFFKTNDHDIGLEGNKQMPVYLSISNMLDFKNREEANKWYRDNIEGYGTLDDDMKREVKKIDNRMNSIENEMFRDGVTDEEYETLSGQWDELLEEMRTVENNYRGRLRELLNDYFLNGNSEYDGIHLGYDGHRYVDGKRENVETYIVFKNTQVKSATDNIGTFDRSNPDIRYQERSQGYDFSDFGFDLIEDDGSIENSFAREYSKHSEDIGEVLKNIAAIEIAPSKVESIIRRVVRNSLGGIGTLAFDSNILHFACIMIIGST